MKSLLLRQHFNTGSFGEENFKNVCIFEQLDIYNTSFVKFPRPPLQSMHLRPDLTKMCMCSHLQQYFTAMLELTFLPADVLTGWCNRCLRETVRSRNSGRTASLEEKQQLYFHTNLFHAIESTGKPQDIDTMTYTLKAKPKWFRNSVTKPCCSVLAFLLKIIKKIMLQTPILIGLKILFQNRSTFREFLCFLR